MNVTIKLSSEIERNLHKFIQCDLKNQKKKYRKLFSFIHPVPVSPAHFGSRGACFWCRALEVAVLIQMRIFIILFTLFLSFFILFFFFFNCFSFPFYYYFLHSLISPSALSKQILLHIPAISNEFFKSFFLKFNLQNIISLILYYI